MPHILKQIQSLARKRPNKIALIDGSTQVTYDRLFRLVIATRDYLRGRLDVSGGGYAVILMSASIDAWVAVLAARSLGLDTIVADKIDSFVFSKLPTIRTIICNDAKGAFDRLQSAHGSRSEIVSLPGWIYADANMMRLNLRKNDIPDTIGGHVCYSSGSTGAPKLVQYSSKHEEAAALSRIKPYRIVPGSKIHNTGTSLWAASAWSNHAVAMYAGCTLIINKSDWIFDAFVRQQTTHIFLNSYTIDGVIDFYRRFPFERRDSMLFRVSGGFISYAKLAWIRDHITSNVWIGMGATEVGTIVLTSIVKTEDDSIWVAPNPDLEICILSSDGEPIPIESEGCLAVKLSDDSPSEYLFDDEMSQERFKGGFFYTGDLAVQRSDGRIRLLGRISETISYPGGKMATGPVESKIRDTLSCKNAFVFSRQNDAAEDEIVVCLESAHAVSDADIAWLKQMFGSASKLVVRTIDVFPLLQSGKIDRESLRRQVLPGAPAAE